MFDQSNSCVSPKALNISDESHDNEFYNEIRENKLPEPQHSRNVSISTTSVGHDDRTLPEVNHDPISSKMVRAELMLSRKSSLKSMTSPSRSQSPNVFNDFDEIPNVGFDGLEDDEVFIEDNIRPSTTSWSNLIEGDNIPPQPAGMITVNDL